MRLNRYYYFGKHPLRVTGTALAPLFCALDILSALELDGTSLQSIPDDQTGMATFHTPSGVWVEMTALTEYGFYRFIFTRIKPGSEHFRRWVFRTVIPDIRCAGTSNPAEADPLEAIVFCLTKLGFNSIDSWHRAVLLMAQLERLPNPPPPPLPPRILPAQPLP